MESSGLPGRVHISESTVNFLNGEFELSDGDGASREETIRQARIKTFFIVNVLKPYPQGTLDEKNQAEQNFESNQLEKPNEQQKLLQDTIPTQTNSNDTNNNLNNTERKISNAVARSSVTGQLTSTIVEQVYSNSSSCSNLNQQNQNMDEYHRRLRYELLNRDNVTEETSQILQLFGFNFEPRGLVSVKGLTFNWGAILGWSAMQNVCKGTSGIAILSAESAYTIKRLRSDFSSGSASEHIPSIP
ncbi:hypothetical protein RND71_044222 [Anisodus tanguticus]|uniref:Uncharacterized protein n=1 Tax=Anisodus tanguticus TaxID=243964 RepID=A0AAE1UTN5_9SOLA|nr:hypothetical protein RND71_044222 [Anisodus tanguticus]